MKNEVTYCSAPTEERFVNLTKAYIEELLVEASDGAQTVMVDQIVPPSNLPRYTRYFDDIKVVVVDRDPRDLYLLEKAEWKDGIIPHDDVETFVKWYRYTRKHRETEIFDGKTSLFVQFEDLLYRYEAETARLREFLGFDKANHVAPRTLFVPERSKHNTRKWLEYPQYAADVSYIEKQLSDYLYDYSAVGVM